MQESEIFLAEEKESNFLIAQYDYPMSKQLAIVEDTWVNVSRPEGTNIPYLQFLFIISSKFAIFSTHLKIIKFSIIV